MPQKMFIVMGLAALAGCQGGPQSSAPAPKLTATTAPSMATPSVTASATMPPAAPTTQPKLVAKFGPDQKLTDADSMPVEKILTSPADYSGKYVRVTGIVSAVCPTKGCWLRVVPEPGSGHGDVFVKFVDPPEGRLVPMDAVGHDVTVEGTVRNGFMSEAQARHLKLDAGASQEEIDKIVGPQPQVMMGSPAVIIEGVKQPVVSE